MGYFTFAEMKVCVKICPPRLIFLVVEPKVVIWLQLAQFPLQDQISCGCSKSLLRWWPLQSEPRLESLCQPWLACVHSCSSR